MPTPLLIENGAARRLFLDRHCLSDKVTAKSNPQAVSQLVNRLGFVQVDSIRTVERAHHMILFARNHNYKQQHLHRALERDRSLFENWTHDASIIPTNFYPQFKHKFQKQAETLPDRWKKWGREGFMETRQEVLDHLHKNGPTLARELKQTEPKSAGASGWWDWHPHKAALEYLWRSGEIAVCHRRGFQKAYDLAANVIPEEFHNASLDEDEFIDWACRSALQRLGFATHGEIAAFWNLISPAQAKHWVEKSKTLIEVEIAGFNSGDRKQAWALREIEDQLANVKSPTNNLRVLSPFDPALRDRKRAGFLFGFDYRIEIFVPEKKRTYGYYVFPILRGSRLVGRIDMKNDMVSQTLRVRKLWLEPKARWSSAARKNLESQLQRIAIFSGMQNVEFPTDQNVLSG